MPPLNAKRELWLFRRGEALPKKQGQGLDDAQRPLTEEGANEIRRIASGLKNLELPPDWIVSSPLLRAGQTAEILREVLGPDIRLDLADALRPGEPPEALASYLSRNKSWTRVLAVGHEPELSRIAAHLIGAGGQASFRLRKGGCCRIDLSRPPAARARLVWWLTPKQLRMLA